MNKQVAKNIRRYVRLRSKDEKYPQFKSEKLYKAMKKTYLSADHKKQEEYRIDMETRFAMEKN